MDNPRNSSNRGNKGGNRNANNKNRRYNPNKKRAKKKAGGNRPQKAAEADSKATPYKKGRPSKNFRSKKPHFRGNNLTAIFKKYDYLMEMHINARRKYYELFHRADKNQKIKLERNYYTTLEQIKKFEASLSEYHRAKLSNRYGDQKMDLTISEMEDNQQYIPDGSIPTEDIQDPHLLESQIQCDFKHDTEESSGTMEDYKNLKV